MTLADPKHFLAQRHRACVKHILLLLPSLIAAADANTTTRGGSLSPVNTILCLNELQERAQTLMLEALEDKPCRVDVAVAIYSIVCKLDMVGSNGFLGNDAWRMAQEQKSHSCALYVQSAPDGGALKHLRVLHDEVRPDWLRRIEASLLEVLGGGFWDVQRIETVATLMRCVCDDIDITACADDCGMLSPQIVDMYFCCVSGAMVKAARAFLLGCISEHKHLPLFVYACLNMIAIFSETYRIALTEPVHVAELSGVYAKVEALLHAVVLLCEYVLLCGEASAKLASAAGPQSDSCRDWGTRGSGACTDINAPG